MRILTFCMACLLTVAAFGQSPKITPPKIGEFTVGDDYFLANYTQLLDYWHKVAKESDRFHLEEIGKTAEGRPILMAIITSPSNYKKLARYKEISQRLARAEGLTDEQAHQLAAEGRAVVWIDAGIHANETVNGQALFTETYDFLTRTDPETLRILNDDILLLVPINPDGMELVANWYMRNPDPKQRSLGNLPRLYQKYVGHDNNRDSYMVNQPETEAVNRQMYIEWIPQIMYNQHQTGPAGSVLFFSPFRDPFNYNQDPLVPIGIDLVSAAVHERFLAEGKPGAVMRTGAPYSTWFNGGDRTTTGFHNQIGLLSEIIGSPSPINIPLVASKLLPAADQPAPIGPRQEWHQRQSIEYLLTSDRAILDIASKFREDFLFRIYRAGKNSIERGSEDYWTLTPKRIAAMEAAYAKDRPGGNRGGGEAANAGGDTEGGPAGFGGGRGGNIPLQYWEQLRSPETRDPRGYIVPSDQPDFLTATKFVDALQKCGIVVHRATRDFEVAGKQYRAGSYVVKAAQAFRPHLRDMLEPQDHPNDFQYPGGPPRPPYDITGYTLAFQMGVQFDRILDKFDGPFEKIEGFAKTPAGRVLSSDGATGYLLSHQVNDAFTGTNRLLAGGEEVYWLKSEFNANGRHYPAGTIYISAKASTAGALNTLSKELGLSFEGTAAKPQGAALKLRPVRVGLWDRYGGSQDSGHIRWMFEKAFPTPYELVFAPALDAGDLKAKYDVLIFPDGALPAESGGRGGRGGRGGGGGGGRGGRGGDVPDEYRNQMGAITSATTGPQLRRFLEEGGTVLAIGSSTTFDHYFELPVSNALVERSSDGTDARLPNTKFYIPGSVLQASVDPALPIAYGIPEKVDVFYMNSPAFRLAPGADQKGVRPIAWFSGPKPLRSGWAWGEQYLNGAVEAIEGDIGKGKVYLFGPEITFRGQPHGTFKFLFNAIYLAGATPVTL
ncbi:MAG TPA: M14 metallopeptidase family protein [Bryobacteraceae bacterium]|nr:M14 metallopeptidase family protein [Bryobacteraceae bacterium]